MRLNELGPSNVDGTFAEPVSLTQAKSHLLIALETTVFDDPIISMIADARDHLEKNMTERSFKRNRWKLILDTFPTNICREVRLPFSPVTAVEVSYTDEDGVAQTLDPTKYAIIHHNVYHGKMDRLLLLGENETWPKVGKYVAEPVAITYYTGYEAVTAVPETAIRIIKLILSQWFQETGGLISTGLQEIPFGARALAVNLKIRESQDG